jgi:hypothetical protein
MAYFISFYNGIIRPFSFCLLLCVVFILIPIYKSCLVSMYLAIAINYILIVFNSGYQIGCLLIVQLFLAADCQLCIGFANCCLNFNRSVYRYLPQLALINDLVCFLSTLSHYLFVFPVWLKV